MSAHNCDLLVVGLGPVGEVMAALARLQGLSVIAIDKALEPYPLPRAAIFDQEIMRIFQMAGVADQIEAVSLALNNYQFLTARHEVLLDFPIADEGRLGWAETYAMHQPSVEAVLRARCAELGVDMRLGAAMTGMIQDEDGVSATVDTADGPTPIRARYVVGCDGAWSAVRAAVGINLEDLGFDEPWLVIDTVGGVSDGQLRVARQICDPQRPTTHGPLAGGRLRWEFMLKPGEDPVAFAAEDNVRKLLAVWGYGDELTIERQAIYRFHALIAPQWRVGRVLIAGDAAHQMPPFAGQGMCSGIRDAANLVWKLGAVIRHGSDPAILDSYQEERAPHARAIIDTAVAMGRVVCMLDEAAAAQRDAGMIARKAAGAQDVTTAYPDLSGGMFSGTAHAGALFPQPRIDGIRLDDAIGEGAVLIGRNLPAPGPGHVRAVDLDHPRFARFAPALDAWLAEAGGAAVLLRPDRHVFGVGGAAALLEGWHTIIRTKIAA